MTPTRTAQRSPLATLVCSALLLAINTSAHANPMLPDAVAAELYGLRGVSQDRPEVGQTVWAWGVGLNDLAVHALDDDGQPLAPPTDTVELAMPGQAAWYDKDYVRLLTFHHPGRYRVRLPETTRAPAEGLKNSIDLVVVPGLDRRTRTLEPGYHELDKPIRLEPGTRLIAHGATVDANGGPLFVMAPDCVIDGGTYRNFSQIGAHGDGSRLTLQHAAFHAGQLGHTWNTAGLTLRNCRFDRTHLNLHRARQVTIARCTFTGVSPGHPVHVTAADGLALIANRFDGTDRGVVIQPRRGPVTNTFAYRNRYENIDLISNGNEVFLVEGGAYPFRHHVDLHSRMTNCHGPSVLLYQADASANLWLGLVSDGGGIVVGAGSDDPPPAAQRNNVWAGCEVAGGLSFGPRADDNLFTRGILTPDRARTSNGRPIERVLGTLRSPLVASDGEGNRVQRSLLEPLAGQPVTRRVQLIDTQVRDPLGQVGQLPSHAP